MSNKTTLAVNDIRPDELMEKKKSFLQWDIDYLKSNFENFMVVDCPACGSSHHESFGEKLGFQFRVCPECSTKFMSPRAKQTDLIQFYKVSKNYEFWNNYIFPATESVRRKDIFIPRALATIEYCKRFSILQNSSLIEIGSAYGIYLDALKELNFFQKLAGVEPSKSLAESGVKKGFEIYSCGIEELKIESEFDVVSCFEVLEHIQNPEILFQKAYSMLKESGLLICSCPNGMGLEPQILGVEASIFDHEHVNLFNPKSIHILAERTGFKLVEITTPGKLDIDLLRRAYLNNPKYFEKDNFLKMLLDYDGEEVSSGLQKIIVEMNLSTHMWAVFKKASDQ